MQAFRHTPLWRQAQGAREYQHSFGCLSGILLAAALIGLFDGLIAQMRQGANELEFLAGQTLTVSGPAVLKNPVISDLVVRFAPECAPFAFKLEGFYTGYWFGNGMWRGQIHALPESEPGTYDLRIAFKGTPAGTAQNYRLKLFESVTALRAGSLSWIRRYLDVNPFILAAWSGVAGIAFGIITYLFGSRYSRFLGRLGLAEIYAIDARTGVICCLAQKALAPNPGNECAVLDRRGNRLGEARVLNWKKGKIWLAFAGANKLPAGALIHLGAC